jgi:dTDP-4-amino-4,6-dideoxygalactose transaminase
MIVCNDPALHERLIAMRAHGSKPKYHHKFVGGNFRLDPLQAAILLVKLSHLDKWSENRRRNAAFYNTAFEGSGVQTPWVSPDCVSIFNQYVIRVAQRDALMLALKQEEIGSEIYYPVPMHLQECFAGKCRTSGSMQESDAAAESVLALPIYPELTEAMLAFVSNTVKKFCEQDCLV